MRVKQQSAKQAKVAKTQWNRYIRARDHGHLDYVRMAKKCDSYYQGNQWDEEDLTQLDAEKRPALTINTILPTVNAFLGEQATRKVDYRCKPKRGTNSELAGVMTKIMNHVADDNRLHWVEAQVFADGLIMDGRGYFDVRLDFSETLEGEIRIKALDPLDVIPDPDAKEYDPESWNEVFYTRWHTLDEISQMYGKDKSRLLEAIAENGQQYSEDSIELEQRTFGNMNDIEGLSTVPQSHEESKTVKSLRVIERQHMKVTRRDYFVDPATGEQKAVPESWSDRKAKTFAKRLNLTIISRAVRRVRWTVTCDHIVLHDEWSPYDTFTIVPYFAYFRRGRPFGMVRNLLSAQDQLNKISSQELHIVNTTANSGWIVQNGSLANMETDDLEQKGAKTGLVVEYYKGHEKPEKIDPNTIPTGLDRIGAKAAQNIKTISGVSDSMLGTDSPEVSGVAIEKKRDVGINLMQVPLENLAFTRQLVADKIINLVQTFYTEPRVFHIIKDEDDPREEREELGVNIYDELTGEVLNNLNVGKYEIVVGTAPARDTFDEIQFADVIAMRSAGIMIPDDIAVRYSSLHKREEVAKRMRIEAGVEMTPEQQEQAALMNQIQMMQLEGEIGKLQAEIQEIQSQAQLNQAKAAEITQIQPNIELTRLQAELAARSKELDTRRELAEISNRVRLQQSEQNIGLKLATTAMQTAAKERANTGEQSNAKDKSSS